MPTSKIVENVKLRPISMNCKDILEGNLTIELLKPVKVPWSVTEAQLKHLSHYNSTHSLDSYTFPASHNSNESDDAIEVTEPIQEDLEQTPLEQTPDVENTHVVYTQTAKRIDRHIPNTVSMAKIIMWTSLPAVIASCIALTAGLTLLILGIVWGFTGTSVPMNLLLIIITIFSGGALIAGPLVIYSEHIEQKLYSEHVRALEEKIKDFGGEI